MQSPSESHRSQVGRLCASIRSIVENYLNTHQGPEEPDLEHLRFEVQTLQRYLELIEKVQSAGGARRPELENSHLRDVDRLLHRCYRTLSSLEHFLMCDRTQNSSAVDQEAPKDLHGLTFSVPRVHISFYKRTLEMSLMSINLAHRWRDHLPQDVTSSDWTKLFKSKQALSESVLQRKRFSGGRDQEDSVEERGLLRDVEQCVRSAEDIMNITTTRISEDGGSSDSSLQHLREAQASPRLDGPPPLTVELALRNGASVAPSHSDSRTDDQPTDGSERDSIIDPEPDVEAGFTAEVYSTIIDNLLQELQKDIDSHEYDRAEKTYRTIVKHYVDRENNLGIRFDDYSELNEKLIEIYLKQQRYQNAKQVLSQLLRETSMNNDRKWRLYISLANAYYGQERFDKALLFAQRSLRGREGLYGQLHYLTHEAASLVIDIFERQEEMATADALRRIYCHDTVPPPPPPPKSALRPLSQPKPPSPPQIPTTRSDSQGQFPLVDQDDKDSPKSNHIRWAPDFWVSNSGIDAIVESGRTSLIDAIHKGDEDYVKLILNKGANVETPCAEKTSPLMHAVNLKYSGIVEILLDHRAQVDVPTSGWTPLHRAIDLGDLTTTRLLLSHNAHIEYRSPLDFAPPLTAKARLRARASDEHDPEAKIASDPSQGWTPLLRAAFKGHEAVVGLLLDQKANIEARNPTKATPLMCASERQHFETVDLLLLRGANVHAQDEYEWQPIHRALVHRSSEPLNPIVPRLLDHEADVNARNNYRKTPLHYAVEKNDAAMVAFLISKDADIEARDSAELTPLHTAIEHRLEPMVRVLLEQGADATAMDTAGQDALAAANHAARKSPEIIALLSRHKKRLKRENSEAAAGKSTARRPTFGERKRGSLGGGVPSNASHAAASPPKKSEKGGWFGRKTSR